MEFVKEEKLTTFKNYDCNIENVLEQIEKFGVAVIPNILNKDEINNMRKGLWDTIEYLSCNLQQPIDSYDIKTWENWYQLLPNHYSYSIIRVLVSIQFL